MSNTMNILHTIEVDVEKFFANTVSHLGNWAKTFVRIFGKSPSALQAVLNFVMLVSGPLEFAVSLVNPVLEPAVAKALSVLEAALAAIQTAAMDANSGQSLLDNLKRFAADVPAILGAIEIKNPALKAAVVKLVNLIVGEAAVLIPAVEAWVKEIEAKAAANAAPADPAPSAA